MLAFDQIDHNIVTKKLIGLEVRRFLTERRQCVRLGQSVTLNWDTERHDVG